MTGREVRMRQSTSLAKTLLRSGAGRFTGLLRFIAYSVLALGLFALVLLIAGKNPLRAYLDIFTSAFGSTYGFSEVLVRMIPLVLTAWPRPCPRGSGSSTSAPRGNSISAPSLPPAARCLSPACPPMSCSP